MATSSSDSELEKELAALEAQLLELRHASDSPPPPSGRRGRRTRLRKELAAIEAAIEKQHHARGTRELSPKERAALGMMDRIALGLLVLGALVLCVHLGWRASLRMAWRETTCAITLHGGEDHVAETVVHGRPYAFPAGESADTADRVRCWVPEPPLLGDLGRLEPPKSGDARVRLSEKTSLGWVIVALLASALGAFFFVLNRRDRDDRLANRTAKDHFSDPD